jgi:allophanate hydrolase subunit 2
VHGGAVSVAAGQRFLLGPVTRGARCYVAVSGGIATPPVLGSRSTDTLSGLGPPALTHGAVVPVGSTTGEPSGASAVPPRTGGPVVLGCRPGPRADWFADVLRTLTAEQYVVGADSNRVALRLRGPAPVRVVTGELPSEGLVLGAVQVPADGRPVLFLRDHPTTGGYPVAVVVDGTDLARCAQLLPGDRLSFRPVPGAAATV